MALRPKNRNNRLMRMLNSPDKGISRTYAGANGVLSRLFRKMLANLKITGPRFGALMQEYILDRRNGVPDNKKDQTSQRGNLTKEFSRDQMTWKVFMKGMRFLQLVKIVIVIEAHHRDGKTSLHSVDVDIDADDFEELLNQPEGMEASGEHIPVLDFERDLEEAKVQQAGQPNPSWNKPAETNGRPALSSQYWYVWSPKTLLIYETVGYLLPLKWHGKLLERAKQLKTDKWKATEETVRMVRGDAITEAVGYFNEDSKKPSGAAEVEAAEAQAKRGED